MKRFTQIIGLLALATICFVGPAGCNKSTLAPAGVYQGDKILYNADKAITTTYKQFDTFLKWELQYRSVLPVEVSRAADTIRLNAKKWIDSASALRDAYAAQPNPANRDKLQLALDLIDTAFDEAVKYMAANQANAPNKGLTVPGANQ
jgi:hypothetical protein